MDVSASLTKWSFLILLLSAFAVAAIGFHVRDLAIQEAFGSKHAFDVPPPKIVVISLNTPAHAGSINESLNRMDKTVAKTLPLGENDWLVSLHVMGKPIQLVAWLPQMLAAAPLQPVEGMQVAVTVHGANTSKDRDFMQLGLREIDPTGMVVLRFAEESEDFSAPILRQVNLLDENAIQARLYRGSKFVSWMTVRSSSDAVAFQARLIELKGQDLNG